jgi:hypothetical protein
VPSRQRPFLFERLDKDGGVFFSETTGNGRFDDAPDRFALSAD